MAVSNHKIIVAIPSYKNPAGLISSVKNMHEFAANPDNLLFRLGLDFDDNESHESVKWLGFANIEIVDFAKDTAHSDFLNLLCPPDSADFYALHCDDGMCITQKWDEEFVKSGEHVVFWDVVNHPGAAIACGVSNAWIKACGYTMPPYFPFWFGDTWLDELRTFVTGKDSGINHRIMFYFLPGKTTGMKDLDYWWGFFNTTRKLRIEKAWQIFMKLGGIGMKEEFVSRAENLSVAMRGRDSWNRARIPMLEGICTEVSSNKIERHIKCRSVADALMGEHALQLWGDINP